MIENLPNSDPLCLILNFHSQIQQNKKTEQTYKHVRSRQLRYTVLHTICFQFYTKVIQ